MYQGKTIFDFFKDYNETEIINSINTLNTNNQKILKKAFGKNLTNKCETQNLNNKEKQLLQTILNKTLKKELEKKQPPKKNTSILTNDIIYDMFHKIEYIPLTKEEEKTWIKRLKLAFYNKVDDKTKIKYLNYYFETNPRFKEKYEKANTKEKDILLKNAIEDANKYRKEFIKNNQRLILIYIKSNTNISREDFLQEANIGLMKAIEKFDIELDNRFSTYAVWWIKQSISRYTADNENTIRIPSNTYTLQQKFIKAESKLYDELQREPTISELSKELNISEEKVKQLQLNVNNLNKLVSLSTPLNEDGIDKIEDLIKDNNSEFEDEINQKFFILQIIEIIKKLDQRSQKIIYMHLGLKGEKQHTLSEIAKTFGVSKGTIRQIELKALHKIRLEYYKQENRIYITNQKRKH